MNFKAFILTTVMALGAMSMMAASPNAPTVVKFAQGSSQKIYVGSISNNGRWAISQKGSENEGTIVPSGGILIDLNTMSQRNISDASGVSGVADVSNDGLTVVGECLGKPAFWDGNTDKWVTLPQPLGTSGGRLNGVTPDGRYAVGFCNVGGNEMRAVPVMYDLVEKTVIETPGLPTKDLYNEVSQYRTFSSISADGRYILGVISYIYPDQTCAFVYDRETGTYDMIGFDENFSGKWKAHYTGLHHIDEPQMSPNGLWVTGMAYMSKEIAGSEFFNEYNATFRYNVVTGEFEVYDADGESDCAGFMVDNDGVVYAVTPAQNPMSSVLIRKGKYFYNISEVFRQAYDYNFTEVTGYEVTGKPCSVSDDGLVMSMLYYTDESYLLRLKEPLINAVDKVDLLGNYSFSPADGVTMSAISSVKLTFDRNVAIIGNPQNVELRDENGQKVRSAASVTVDKNNVNIGFRSTTIPEGKRYSIYIPAGMFSINGDASIKNQPIEVFYNGRGSSAVAVKNIYPANGAAIAGLDVNNNPIVLTFDSDLKLKSENTVAKLYREGESDSFCDLYVAVSGKQIMLYPLAEQHLYKDTEYKVVVPAGLVVDLSGNGDNEELTIHYSGTYVRQISSDDKYLFADECDNYDNFMFYDGDKRTPAQTPAGWGFTAETTPWYIVAESNASTDMALASHSMYSPAGQADDWMVTPQLFIPDKDCFLQFQSQSYRKNKEDYLKVYVYTCDDVYNTLTADIVNKIRTEGDLIYSELQDPGESEEGLSDDWRDNTVALEKYAGQNVYIAFVNDNNDQSAIFIDNVQVLHDMKYFTSFTNPDRVVNQESIAIRGAISVQSEVSVYNNVSLTLKDGNANVIDEIKETGCNLGKDDVYTFAFATPLALSIGSVNNYSVEISLDDDKTVVNSSVRNLVFEPEKRIVLEEYSGADCANCPQGFQAIKNIDNLYPGTLLPIVLRTYGGDPELAVGLDKYHSFLGLQQVGAPSGRINRGNPAYPMILHNGRYLFTGAGIPNSLTGRDEECWLDLVRQELASPADASVGIESAVDASGKVANLKISVKSALDLTKQSLNLFAVVVEDGVETYQANGFSSVEDENLGDWSKNGIWGGMEYVYPCIIDHCARATAGATFNGTGGLVPTNLKAGETYNSTMAINLPQSILKQDNCHVIVMLIDAGTGKVVNANVAPLNGSSSGIGNVNMDKSEVAIEIFTTGSVINVAAEDAVVVDVYNTGGALITAAAGTGNVNIDLTGNNGIFIVKASTLTGEKVQKIVIR